MASTWTLDALVKGVRTGDRRAIARAISVVENGDSRAGPLIRDLYKQTGSGYLVGFTGPPGVGKSTLISAIVRHVRNDGASVGVISVDPSSPFTEGALLGDRIRLSDHFLDPEVFIRSMGTRGHLGGISEATLQVALVLDASGKELLFLETVGTGQSEVEVITIADTVVLVLQPASGDSVQALKAGIMEIPDVIAINKCDHPATTTLVKELELVLTLGESTDWRPPIVLTEAIREEGASALWDAVRDHRRYLDEHDLLDERRARNLATEVFHLASARATRHLETAVVDDPELTRLLDRVKERRLDPLTAVEELLEKVFRVGDDATISDEETKPE